MKPSPSTKQTATTKKWEPRSTHDEETTSRDGYLTYFTINFAFLLLLLSVVHRTLEFFAVDLTTSLSKLSPTLQSIHQNILVTGWLTIPSVTLGSLECSILLLLMLWFYTQSSHESREANYYHEKMPIFTKETLEEHGMGCMPADTKGCDLYLDTMKRSLLNLPYCESSRPVYFYGADKRCVACCGSSP
jgi:hypothetical protein